MVSSVYLFNKMRLTNKISENIMQPIRKFQCAADNFVAIKTINSVKLRKIQRF